MSFTTTQYQALQDALATGELTVEFDGKKVTYRSIEELRQALAVVKAELVAAGQLSESVPRRSYAQHSKGS